MAQILLPLLTLSCLCCVSLAVDVIQTPGLILPATGESVNLTCVHEDSAYPRKFWYRQLRPGEPIIPIGNNYREQITMEKDFEGGRFKIYHKRDTESELVLSDVSNLDNAIYYCASSITSGASVVYFGEGTIVSVLGEGEEEKDPKVKVFPPNKNEFQVHKLISLVCIATGFFPEHVRLTWYVNGVQKKDLYQNVPTKELDGTYSTSKRLSLTESEYFNPDSTFKCEAAFIGKEDKAVFDEIKGEQNCGVSKESFAMMINQGKISYIMVLFKSAVYALIVLVIIWRKKVLSGSC